MSTKASKKSANKSKSKTKVKAKADDDDDDDSKTSKTKVKVKAKAESKPSKAKVKAKEKEIVGEIKDFSSKPKGNVRAPRKQLATKAARVSAPGCFAKCKECGLADFGDEISEQDLADPKYPFCKCKDASSPSPSVVDFPPGVNANRIWPKKPKSVVDEETKSDSSAPQTPQPSKIPVCVMCLQPVKGGGILHAVCPKKASTATTSLNPPSPKKKTREDKESKESEEIEAKASCLYCSKPLLKGEKEIYHVECREKFINGDENSKDCKWCGEDTQSDAEFCSTECKEESNMSLAAGVQTEEAVAVGMASTRRQNHSPKPYYKTPKFCDECNEECEKFAGYEDSELCAKCWPTHSSKCDACGEFRATTEMETVVNSPVDIRRVCEKCYQSQDLPICGNCGREYPEGKDSCDSCDGYGVDEEDIVGSADIQPDLIAAPKTKVKGKRKREGDNIKEHAVVKSNKKPKIQKE